MTDKTGMQPWEFRDTQGHVWSLKINLLIAHRITNSNYENVTKLKVNMLPPEDKLFTEFFGNVQLVFAVMFTIVQEQLDKYGMESEEEFLALFDGDLIQDARDAFWMALVDFCPNQRIALKRYHAAVKATEQRIAARLEEKGEQMDKMLAHLVDSEIDKLMNDFTQEAGIPSVPGPQS